MSAFIFTEVQKNNVFLLFCVGILGCNGLHQFREITVIYQLEFFISFYCCSKTTVYNDGADRPLFIEERIFNHIICIFSPVCSN